MRRVFREPFSLAAEPAGAPFPCCRRVPSRARPDCSPQVRTVGSASGPSRTPAAPWHVSLAFVYDRPRSICAGILRGLTLSASFRLGEASLYRPTPIEAAKPQVRINEAGLQLDRLQESGFGQVAARAERGTRMPSSHWRPADLGASAICFVTRFRAASGCFSGRPCQRAESWALHRRAPRRWRSRIPASPPRASLSPQSHPHQIVPARIFGCQRDEFAKCLGCLGRLTLGQICRA